MKKFLPFLCTFSTPFFLWASEENVLRHLNSQTQYGLEKTEYYFTGINKFQLNELNLEFSLNPKKDLYANIYWAHFNSKEDALSISDQLQMYIEKGTDQNSFRIGINYWNDPETRIRSIGPGIYWIHSFKNPNHSIEVGLDQLNYQASLTSPRKNERMTLTQYRPNIKYELSFPKQHLKLTPSYSLYTYNRSPQSLVEMGSANNQFFESTLYGSSTSYINGFLKQEYNLSFNYSFIESTELIMDYGEGQSAIDKTWSQSFGPTISVDLSKSLNLQISYNRTIMTGINYHYWTSGISFTF